MKDTFPPILDVRPPVISDGVSDIEPPTLAITEEWPPVITQEKSI